MTFEILSQIAIALLGGVAILLVARKSKWGMVLGLLSQPFWWYTTIVHEQWGIVAVNVLYTYSWSYGTWRWFRDARIK